MMRNDAELKARLDQLAKLGAPELRAEWTSICEGSAPRHISHDLLLRGIAYRLQEQMYGGLKPATSRKLKQISGAAKEGRDMPEISKPELRPGARLFREWKGQTHIVEVLSEGFAWRGKTYGSLSKVANLITGLSWSGPVFFGLRDKRRKVTARAKGLAEHLK